jgi:hypothetical protein
LIFNKGAKTIQSKKKKKRERERIAFSNGAKTTRFPQAKRMKLDSLFTAYIKINSK